MAYEVFTRKVHRVGTPTISFARNGQIRFNQPAASVLQKDAVENVLLLWDPDAKKVAIKSISNKKDTRAYRIRYSSNNNGAGFSAKTFLDYVGIDYSERRSMQVDVNPDREMLIEFAIPEGSLKKSQPGQPRIMRQAKMG